ncbi:phosphoenolpyruvate phosphomutase [Elysia marginata]|uniref:Phosphoenolpyruvate phosphomutase n=1 Tax=Elysia marginata TaxID=1093978 RepID=A0AAV4G6Z8_9GAST|nr:phosphoenolpyruvate phosphomutase [Elysia marginata]
MAPSTCTLRHIISSAVKSKAPLLSPAGLQATASSFHLTQQHKRCYAVETGIRKTTKLRQMLQSSELEFIMEAHSGISACIAEEAGFKGIWGSGLSMATQLGVRDSNEASWTQFIFKHMYVFPSVPIAFPKPEGAAVEDKLFPKTNSLLDGRAQPLADVKEFALKIQAMKEAQRDPDFNIIARVEALIAGWGVDEALKRADAYLEAGATAILMHSKLSEPKDIRAFLDAWQNKGPIVLVPTTYYKTPVDEWRQRQVSLIIWANHSIRASVKAMQDLTKHIYENQSTAGVEDKIVTVKELFRLTKDDELKKAEDKYLPKV